MEDKVTKIALRRISRRTSIGVDDPSYRAHFEENVVRVSHTANYATRRATAFLCDDGIYRTGLSCWGMGESIEVDANLSELRIVKEVPDGAA